MRLYYKKTAGYGYANAKKLDTDTAYLSPSQVHRVEEITEKCIIHIRFMDKSVDVWILKKGHDDHGYFFERQPENN